MEKNKRYGRIEDMSPDGTLTIFMQSDGDIIVEVWGRDIGERLERAQVEFCALGSGGGRSPHTREALIALAKAIEKDNEENPIEKQGDKK